MNRYKKPPINKFKKDYYINKLPVNEIARKYKVSKKTIYNWAWQTKKRKY